MSCPNLLILVDEWIKAQQGLIRYICFTASRMKIGGGLP